MRRFLSVLVMLLILSAGTVGQIQHKYVGDFTGGVVNGLANVFVPDNAAQVLSNFDVKDGALTRRSGMGFIAADTGAPYIGALFPYSHYRDKELFAFRHIEGRLSSDTADAYTQTLVRYGKSSLDLEYILENRVFNGPWRAHQYENISDYTHVFHRLFIAGYNSEFVYVTDSILLPARPRAPGQALVTVLNGGGDITGLVRYRYLYVDKDAPDTSNFSVPTFIKYVDNGKVYIYDMDTATTASGVDSIVIYREVDRSGDYEYLARIPQGQTYYLDNDGTNSGVTLNHNWGPIPKPEQGSCTDTTDCDDDTEHLTAPGEITTATVDIIVAGDPGVDLDLVEGATTCHQTLYTYRFRDSLGRYSFWAPWHPVPISCVDGRVDSLRVTLSGYQSPKDSGITQTSFAKCYLSNASGNDQAHLDNWYNDAVAVIDEKHPDSLTAIYTGWTTQDLSDIIFDDSVWTFDPSIIEYHANRMWGAGDLEYPDYLYYSALGAPTTLQAFIRVPSQQGDAITGLLSIADVDYYDDALPADQMVLFKEASVWAVSGFTFANFRLSQLMSGVGLVATRGYCKTNVGVYFVGADGMYQLGSPQPISLAIQATVDSASQYLSRSVVRPVGDEVWWSLPIGDTVNNRTLVWSETPKPHWRSYSFAMRDVIPYDTNQEWTAHATDRALILTETDSVFRWNYVDTDSLDGDTRIQATYRSKFFFEGGGRENIRWIDIFGTGESAVLKFVFLRNYAQGTGDRFDSAYITPDFTDDTRDRIKVDAVCENFAIEIIDSAGLGVYTITGYDIAYIPWDLGKRR